MPAWSKISFKSLKSIKSTGTYLAIFILGFLTHMYFNHTEKAADTEVELVEKVSDDSLKVADEIQKNLKVSQVQNGQVPEQLSIMGKISVAEDRTNIIAARVSGRIDQVLVASGTEVKAGQALMTLFSPDFVIAKEEYLQTLAQQKTTGDAEDKKLLGLSRQKLESMGVSRYDIDHLSESGEKSQFIVRAPRSGAVLDKKAVTGNLVNPGDPLFTVGDVNSVWFAGDVYPNDLSKIEKGQKVMIETKENGPSVQGKISFISPVVDPVTRTIKVRAQMENLANSLRVDMFVKGNIILSERQALTVPKTAVIRDGANLICFKELPNHIFKKVNIETAGESPDAFIISKGLEVGDHVVSEGALLLSSALSTAGASHQD